jgi:hypothetical protein
LPETNIATRGWGENNCTQHRKEKDFVINSKTTKTGRIISGAFVLAFLFIFSSSAYAFGITEGWEVTGFIRNNSGIFLNHNQDFTQSSNQLATERSWLRLKLDGNIIPDTLSIRLVGQFIYEPKYDIEKGANIHWNEYSEVDLREAYMTYKPVQENTLRIGRQIAAWGESLAFRVGDVINPVDSRFAFTFVNPEDNRIPQWMLRDTQQFPSIRSSIEFIVNPLWTDDKYRVDPLYAEAGTQASCASTSGCTPGWRFAPYPDMRTDGINAVMPYGGTSILPAPLGRSYAYYSPIPFVLPVGYWPTEIPSVRYETPTDNIENLRYGARTSTTAVGYQFGAFYWHTQEYTPVMERGGTRGTTDVGALINPLLAGLYVVPNRDYIMRWPNVNIFGLYANKDMPLGVLRTEATYRPKRTYNTLDPNEPSALTKKDTLSYLLAWDIQTMFRPLSETGTIDINLEYVGDWILEDASYLNVTGYLTPVHKDTHTFLFNIGTNWNYSEYSAGVMVIYNVYNNGAILPSVKWTPDWYNKAFSFDLKYINVFGKDDFEGMGLFRQKDMLVFTTQFSF